MKLTKNVKTKRMKTSSKIFIGAACVAVVVCAVNLVIARGVYKKYDAPARELARQMNENPTRVLDVTVGLESELLADWLCNENCYGNTDDEAYLNIKATELGNARVAGDTLFLVFLDDDSKDRWQVFNSPGLETVVVHLAGGEDLVFGY
jgi:hypothetical protein